MVRHGISREKYEIFSADMRRTHMTPFILACFSYVLTNAVIASVAEHDKRIETARKVDVIVTFLLKWKHTSLRCRVSRSRSKVVQFGQIDTYSLVTWNSVTCADRGDTRYTQTGASNARFTGLDLPGEPLMKIKI